MTHSQALDLIANVVMFAAVGGLCVVAIWTGLIRSAVSLGRNLTKPWNMNEPNLK